MKQFRKIFSKDDRGLTLVELLASIVIISIILISVISIFTKTAKTNYTSGEIIDATYLAQTEMEKIYEHSKTHAEPVGFTEYVEAEGENDWERYRKQEDDFLVELSLMPAKESLGETLSRVVIRVFDREDSEKPKAQMEHLLKWGDQDEASP